MLINPASDDRPIHEIRDRTKFRRIMESRPGQRVRIIIQVAPRHHENPREPGPWWNFMTFWEGPWSDDLPVPTEPVLKAIMAQAGAAFARPVLRAVI